jgi:hypothetical protein
LWRCACPAGHIGFRDVCREVMLGDASRGMYPRGHTHNYIRLRFGNGGFPTLSEASRTQSSRVVYLVLRLMQRNHSFQWAGRGRGDHSSVQIAGDSTVVLPISWSLSGTRRLPILAVRGEGARQSWAGCFPRIRTVDGAGRAIPPSLACEQFRVAPNWHLGSMFALWTASAAWGISRMHGKGCVACHRRGASLLWHTRTMRRRGAPTVCSRASNLITGAPGDLGTNPTAASTREGSLFIGGQYCWAGRAVAV